MIEMFIILSLSILVTYPLESLSFTSSPSCPPPHSDGMSRTGVFITTMAEVERVKVQGVVDIFQTVKATRSERPHMVSTPVSRGKAGVGWRGEGATQSSEQAE